MYLVEFQLFQEIFTTSLLLKEEQKSCFLPSGKVQSSSCGLKTSVCANWQNKVANATVIDGCMSVSEKGR